MIRAHILSFMKFSSGIHKLIEVGLWKYAVSIGSVAMIQAHILSFMKFSSGIHKLIEVGL
jgi:hypothetical protein